MGVMIISNKSFQPADADRLAFDPAHAFGFTLLFLRTHSAADCGERRRFCDHLIRLFKPALRHERDKIRNGNIDRAAGNARAVFTV